MQFPAKESVPGRGKSKRKGPEYSRNSKEPSVTEAE